MGLEQRDPENPRAEPRSGEVEGRDVVFPAPFFATVFRGEDRGTALGADAQFALGAAAQSSVSNLAAGQHRPSITRLFFSLPSRPARWRR